MFRKADRERIERMEQAILELRLAVGDRPKDTHYSLHLKVQEMQAGQDKLMQSHAALEKQLQDIGVRLNDHDAQEQDRYNDIFKRLKEPLLFQPVSMNTDTMLLWSDVQAKLKAFLAKPKANGKRK